MDTGLHGVSLKSRGVGRKDSLIYTVVNDITPEILARGGHLIQTPVTGVQIFDHSFQAMTLDLLDFSVLDL